MILDNAPYDAAALARIAQAVDPSARLLPTRLVKRVIRRHFDLPIGQHVSHNICFEVARDELLECVDATDLGGTDGLPERVLLLPLPDDEQTLPQALVELWRGLFHAAIDRAVGQTAVGFADQPRLFSATVLQEIRAVLQDERRLASDDGDGDLFREFAAFFLELRFFSPALLGAYFPGFLDPEMVTRLLEEQLGAQDLFVATRPAGAPGPAPFSHGQPAVATMSPGALEFAVSPATAEHRAADTILAATRGNDVRAAIDLRSINHVQQAEDQLKRLIGRLRHALQYAEADEKTWYEAARPLLEPACQGRWNVEMRLLYELQKACLDIEHKVYDVDLIECLVSYGEQPLVRLLDKPRDVNVLRRLRAALNYSRRASLADEQREPLDHLLRRAIADVEGRVREDNRPILEKVLDEVGIVPENQAEHIARHKIVEELLDVICLRGFLKMTDLRDALARNRLKLNDLSGPSELLFGDPLIQANRKLAVRMDGIYRRSEIYMRTMQRGSSAAFGTAVGRLLMLFAVLPFGGAFVALEGTHHFIEAIAGIVHFLDRKIVGGGAEPAIADANVEKLANLVTNGSPEEKQNAQQQLEQMLRDSAKREQVKRDLEEFAKGLAGEPKTDFEKAVHEMRHNSKEGSLFTSPAAVVLLGLVLLGLIHWPAFRRRMRRTARIALLDIPTAVLESAFIRGLIDNRVTRFAAAYLLTPVLAGGLVAIAMRFLRYGWESTALIGGGAALLIGVVFRTSWGRGLEERLDEALGRFWRIVSVNFLVGLLLLIVQFFTVLMEYIEKGMYAVDEWLRFREGASRLSIAFKLLFGTVWFFIAYVFRFAWNLLIEPQINPIKHFPVVTVSHKLLLPMVGSLAKTFNMPITTMTTIVSGIPGIFGFLVWELKENWKLYKANRPPEIGPVPVGSHGERMRALLRPGFHSGAVPKTYAKLRQAESAGKIARAVKLHHALQHIAEAVHHLVQRELAAYLRDSQRWGKLPLVVEPIRLATNRLRVPLTLDGRGLVVISIEERGGWLIGSIEEAGWLGELSDKQRAAFQDALAGFYKLSGVEVLREQAAAVLGIEPYRLDCRPKEWLVLPKNAGETVGIDYDDQGSLTPQAPIDGRMLPPLPVAAILLSERPLGWGPWVERWEQDQAGKAPTEPLVAGYRMLPDGVV
jgi:hypothetical protein